MAGDTFAAGVYAQLATPAATTAGETFFLFEHTDTSSEIDPGEPGPSAGHLIVWGPNPLYDEANASDSGATTQGVCVAINAAADCLAIETTHVSDGSTLRIQGLKRGGGQPSRRTIVGGSGRDLGASGTVGVMPVADLTVWEQTGILAADMDQPRARSGTAGDPFWGDARGWPAS